MNTQSRLDLSRKAAMLAMVLAVALFAACALCSQRAFAAADDVAASGGGSQIVAQASESKNIATIKKFIKAVNALPAASKVKLTDGFKVAKAESLHLSAMVADEELDPYENGSWGSAYKSLYKKYTNACTKYDDVETKYDKIVKKEQKKIGKRKVAGVKVIAGKKQATVSWKSFGKKYEYMVLYSDGKKLLQKDSIVKTNTKITGLTTGKKYKFTVIAYRPETLRTTLIFPRVYTTGVSVTKKIK